jgi:hypothetical protein
VALETEGKPSLLDDTSAREVIISWETPSPIRVHVFLKPSDYLAALEAHKTGAWVSVRGVIERTTRKHTLKSPEAFTVLPIEFS